MSLDGIIRVIEIFIGIGLLITVHELGHFLAAKWAGVRVDKFAIGWGPRLLFWRRGETEYSLRVIPFGGFCAMAGEAPGVPATDEPEREFRNQPPGKKAVILFAGGLMNFILGVVLFSIALGVGVNFTRPLIGLVHPQSPAETAGLLAGDEIIAVNGKENVDWEDVLMTIAMGGLEDNVSLRVLREGKELTFAMRPRKSKVRELPELGIEPASGRTITEIDEKGPAADAGFKQGDVIDTIDGVAYLRWEDALYHMASCMGKPVSIELVREGKRVPASPVPRPAKKGSVGIVPKDFPRVAGVVKGSPAEGAGMKTDDEILKVDGKETPFVADIIACTAPNAGKEVVYTVRRGGAEVTVKATPVVREGQQTGSVGIHITGGDQFIVGTVQKGSAAETAGIRPGDTLTTVGGYDLKEKQLTWDSVRLLLDEAAKGDGKLTLGWKHADGGFEKKTLAVRSVEDPLRADIGLTLNPALQWERKYAPWRAPVVGVKKSWLWVQRVYLFLRGMLTRRISPKHAAGPVGIIKMSYRIASQGIPKLIYWLAILGVNLAVVNLLPMVPLDGGLLVLTLIEKLRGKAMSEKWLIRLQLAGWCVVLVLVTLITINDIRR